MRVHIIPALGRIKLTALTPRDVQLLVSHLRKSVAPASVIKIHGVLRNALADAERMDLVPRNVAKSVRSATLSRTERRVLTPVEASKLLRELEGDRLVGVFVVALSTGLRRGELLGLRWKECRPSWSDAVCSPDTATHRRRASLRSAKDPSLGPRSSAVAARNRRDLSSAREASRGPTPGGTGVGRQRPGVCLSARNSPGAQECQPTI